MNAPIYQVDAFTDSVFGGNPAAVVVLDRWIEAQTMQKVGAENNLSETAFVVKKGDVFELRWFSPTIEVDLCGHATLAAAHVLFAHGYASGPSVRFSTQSGELVVTPDGDMLSMDFPSRPARVEVDPEPLAAALGAHPLEVRRSRDALAVFETQAQVAGLSPDFAAVARLDEFAVIVTAPGEDCDFVSRFFAPGVGIDEDPVTGSAHCTLVPYWSARLGKETLRAKQISKRGGELFCKQLGDRVAIAGRAVEYMQGQITVA